MIFLLPKGPICESWWTGGKSLVWSTCMIKDAVIKGEIPKATTLKRLNPPPPTKSNTPKKELDASAWLPIFTPGAVKVPATTNKIRRPMV